MERKIDLEKAEKARADGNAAFKQGKWIRSIGFYTTAVMANPKEALAYTNRAAAYLKVDKYLDAERDCTTALDLQANNVKALYRRAIARKHMDMLPEAQADLNEVLKLDRGNESAAMELAEVKSLVKKRENQAKAAQETELRLPRSAPGLTASIEEIEDVEPTREVSEADSQESKQASTPAPSSPPALPTPASIPEVPKAPSSFANLKQTRDQKKVFVGGQKASSSTPIPETGATSSGTTQPPSDGTKTSLPKPTPATSFPAATNSASNARSNADDAPTSTPAVASIPTAPTQSKASVTTSPRPPSSPRDPCSTSVGAGLRLLRHLESGTPSTIWTELSYYPAPVVPTILKSLLEPDTLGLLLLALRQGVEQDPTNVREILTGLKGTDRWRMNAAMLSTAERTAGQEAWTLSQGDGAWP